MIKNEKVKIMPGIDNLLGSAGGAAASNILDLGISSAIQGFNNRAQRKFAQKMYNRQRADALSDWTMQNEYNAPSAQMERLKAAKLNPNLIYGTGVQASGLSGSVRASTPQSYKPEGIQSTVGNAFSAYVDTKMKQTQMDTMRSVQEVNNARKAQIDADTVIKGAQKGLIDVTSAARAFKLGLDKSMVGITVDTASAQLDKLRAEKDRIVTDTFYKMHEDIRRTMLANTTNREKIQHIALMVAQEFATREGAGLTMDNRRKIAQEILNLEKQGVLEDLNIQLKSGEVDFQVLKEILGKVPSIFVPLRK